MQTAVRPTAGGTRPKGCYKCGGTGHWAKVSAAGGGFKAREWLLECGTRACCRQPPTASRGTSQPRRCTPSPQDCTAPKEQWLPYNGPSTGARGGSGGAGPATGGRPGSALPDGQVGLGEHDPLIG